MTLLNVFKPSAVKSASSCASAVDDSGLAHVRPRYEIDESEDAFVVDVDLPGVSKEDLSITHHDGLLEVVGKRDRHVPKGWTPLGDSAGEAFAYRLRLMMGDRVDAKGISADSENGVLRLTLPKEEEQKPRRILIN